jgi:hypothetical protein
LGLLNVRAAVDSGRCQKFIRPPGRGTRLQQARILSFVQLGRTISKKAVTVIDDIYTLSNAAASPRFRPLFDYKLKIIPVPSKSTEATTIPQTAEEWENILEKALSYDQKQLAQLQDVLSYCQKGHEDIRRLIGTKCEPKVMNMAWISEDTDQMAEEALGRELVVHSEVAVLLHIAREESLGVPRAYSYIGVSNPSCGACDALFWAYNRVHQTRFVARATHKSFTGRISLWTFPRRRTWQRQHTEFSADTG